MDSTTKYKIFNLSRSKENSHFDLVFKLNPENDNDFIINMKISHEIYSIEKLNQMIIVELIINIENNKFDIFINYNIKHGKEHILIDDKTKKEIISEKIFQNEIDVIISILKCIIENKNVNKIPLDIVKNKEYNYDIEMLELLNTSSVDLISLDHKDDLEIEKQIYYHLNLITMQDKYDINKNIFYIILDLIKFIENFKLKGENKKKILIKTLHTFLKEKNYIHTEYLIQLICPSLIDILISIDKRKIILKKQLNSCIFPFI